MGGRPLPCLGSIPPRAVRTALIPNLLLTGPRKCPGSGGLHGVDVVNRGSPSCVDPSGVGQRGRHTRSDGQRHAMAVTLESPPRSSDRCSGAQRVSARSSLLLLWPGLPSGCLPLTLSSAPLQTPGCRPMGLGALLRRLHQLPPRGPTWMLDALGFSA